MEVIWKTVYVILDHHLGIFIEFHDIPQCFCSSHGVGPAYLEAKILQKMA